MMREKEWLKQSDPMWNEELKIIFQNMQEGNILDMGCGDGTILKSLGDKAIGVDVDKEALNICRKKGLTVIHIDLNCPFNLERKFNTIVCLSVLEHLVYPEIAVQSAYKHLKRNGIFIIAVPYHGLIKNLIIALFGYDSHYHYTDWHLRFFTMNTFSEMLVKNGFKIIKILKIGRFNPINKNMIAICKRVD